MKSSPFADFGSDPVRQLILPAAAAVPLALALGFGGVNYMVALAIVGVGAGLFLANPRAFILGFLMLISLRNFIAGGERMGTEGLNFDLGGLANVLATGIGIVYFLVLWKNPFKGRSLTLPYGVFLGLFAISMFWAPDFRWAVRFVTRLAAPFFTYLIISDMIDRKMVRQVISAMYASSVIPIVYGFFQWITGTGNDVTEGYNRVNSSFFHPAHFSMYLTFLFCLAYAEFLDPRVKNRALRLLYIVLLVALEISTYTRISWLAMGLCFLYLSWVYGKRAYIFAAAAVGGVVLLGFGGGILERFTSVGDVLGSDNVYDLNSSVGWRLYFWDEIIRRFWDRPWFGFGAGSSVMLGVEIFGVEAAPHNGYLRVLYETGIVGFLAFLWVLGVMFWQGFRMIQRRLDNRLTYISHVYVTMTVTYALLNLTDNILEYYEVAIYQWAILSLVEFNNLHAARAGLITEAGFEEELEAEPEAVLELSATVSEIEAQPKAS
ncbi:MAG: O-antigen ligase family protein [Pseudomonadota bacterium]|nr:O-antigen ligase family protein [Pseudomonadota bacterium]